jgi:hypothetical protein
MDGIRFYIYMYIYIYIYTYIYIKWNKPDAERTSIIHSLSCENKKNKHVYLKVEEWSLGTGKGARGRMGVRLEEGWVDGYDQCILYAWMEISQQIVFNLYN